MSTDLSLPENLSLEQIKEMQLRLKSVESKKVLHRANVKKYHKTDKGKKATKKASMKYYYKNKARKKKIKNDLKKNDLETCIANVKKEIEALDIKLAKQLEEFAKL